MTVVGGGPVIPGVVVRALVGWGDVPRETTRGRGRWTRFGTVAVLGAKRQHLIAKHRTWSETIQVDVEVHNGSDQPILVLPGQFRLRVGSTGPTVSPYEAGWSVGSLGPSETVASWISYLAPSDALDLWLEYAEPGATAPQAFVISPQGSASWPPEEPCHIPTLR